MTTPRVQSETEKVLRQQCAGDELETIRLDLIFGEVQRAADAQAAADREDVRRAAEGRRVLG